MATNFLVPFALDGKGSIATTSDNDVIAMQRIRALMATSPGSRVMLPDYGVNLPGYLFNADLPGSSDKLANDIHSAIDTWEPSISVIEVTPVTNSEATGFEDVHVEFTTSSDQAFTPTLIATVLVGGTVVKD